MRGVCVQSAWETAKRTVRQPRCSLVFERSVVVLIFFQTHFPFPLSSQPTTEWIFGPVLGPEGGFGSEYGTHAAPLRYSDFAKSRFRRQMGAARWTTPSLRRRSVVTGTSQLPALLEPNPTLLRPPFPSQFPTEST